MKLPTRFYPPGARWATYEEVAPAGTELSDLLGESYWVHLRRFMRLRDVIQVIAEDDSLDVELRVTCIEPGQLAFRVLREYRDATKVYARSGSDRYEVRSNGRSGGFNIIDKKTTQIVRSGLPRHEAEAERQRLEKHVAEKVAA